MTPDRNPEDALSSPAALRNREPILAVLRGCLPAAGTVLEVASGSGEHAVHFAASLPGLAWQPSDADPAALASVEAHRVRAGLPNLRAPLALDAAAAHWPVAAVDAVVAINMLHISPWRSAEGLMAGCGRVLSPGGRLVLYGPFIEAERETAASNLAFDASLRARDPRWGLRDLAEVLALAGRNGLRLAARHEMPANNLLLVLVRAELHGPLGAASGRA